MKTVKIQADEVNKILSMEESHEPLRDCRRLFGFSYAAMGVVSSMA
jgi:hypothetical protein